MGFINGFQRSEVRLSLLLQMIELNQSETTTLSGTASGG
jgi:hypothetical protein